MVRMILKLFEKGRFVRRSKEMDFYILVRTKIGSNNPYG